MASSQRIEFIDLAKGFCIIFVVMIHVANFYHVDFWFDRKIAAFRMPLFYFLSGVFFRTYGGFINFIKNKTNKLLIPFLFYYLTISVFLQYFFDLLTGDEGRSLLDLLASVYHESIPYGAIWFLFSLFTVSLLFYFCYTVANLFDKNKSLVLVLVSLIFGCIGLLFSYLKIDLPLFIDTSLTTLPFFMAGYLIKNKTKLLSPNRLDKYSLLVILVCFAIVCIFTNGGISFVLNKFPGSYLLALYPCGVIGTIGIIYCAKCLNHLPFVSYLGRYSLIVLVTHGLVFPRLKPYVPLLAGDKPELLYLVNLAATLLICFCLIPIVKRFLPHVTAQKDVFK